MNNRDHFIFGETMSKQENTTSSQQRKQVAMIKWLLTKANKNPEDFRDIFQTLPHVRQYSQNFNCRLHPKIVNALLSAELYSAALANMYIDHHFYNPDHERVLKVLARKGAVLNDPQLTVSVLLKSDPINLSAHLSVIEAIMILYAKEIATSDRIEAAIERFNSPNYFPNDSNSNAVITPKIVGDYDQLLLLWINGAISALNKRIKTEIIQNNESSALDLTKNNKEDYFKNTCKDLNDLSDGIALCALISFYYPQVLSWRKIRIRKPVNTDDCLYNLNLFISACQSCLPNHVFHMHSEDMLSHKINYMRPNVIALLADLFNFLEIAPSNRGGLPDNRKEMNMVNDESEFQPSFPSSDQAYTRKSGNGFQKRPMQQISAIPNLRNYCQNGSNNSESRTANSSPKVDRKVRNSYGDIQSTNNECFVVHKGRNIPTLSSVNPESALKERQETVAAGKPTNWSDNRKNQVSTCGRRSRRNSFSDDSQLTIENFGGSQENISILGRNPDKEPAVHIANHAADHLAENNAGARQLRSQMAAQENWSSAAISSVLFDNSAAENKNKNYQNLDMTVQDLSKGSESQNRNELLENCKDVSQFLAVRQQLEEKRREMEMTKRRMELYKKKQLQKLNNAAFLQAISKIDKTNDGGGSDEAGDGNGNPNNDANSDDDIDRDSIVTYDEDINAIDPRWMRDESTRNFNGDRQFSPDEIDKCQQSISELDSELQMLAAKENEMLRNNAMSELSQNVDVANSMSYMMAHEDQVNQMNRRLLISNQQSQMNEFFSPHQAMNYGHDNRASNYPTFNSHRNFAEVNYNGGYAHHHHSLIATMPAAVAAAKPASSPMHNYEQPSMFAYQPQQEWMQPPGVASTNYNHNNYHSMNVQNSRPSENKENQGYVGQSANEQFYLHGCGAENAPFQLVSPTTASAPLNLSYSSPNTSYGQQQQQQQQQQRKTWDNRADTSGSSPQPTPPPRMNSSRYLSNKEPSVTLTKSFSENRIKTMAPVQYHEDLASDSSSSYSSPPLAAKKSFSSMHQYGMAARASDRFNMSEAESSARKVSVGSTSIPSPSVDEMAPQCISFIGTSDESTINDSFDSKHTKEFNDVNKLNIVNGSRTYRIPSPTNKPHLRTGTNHPFINDNSKSEKGFYVSFSNDDDETDNSRRFTERIKAPQRMKRLMNNGTVSLNKNDRSKLNSIKSKTETPRKPETIYNDKERLNDDGQEWKTPEVVNEKVMEKASDDTIIIKNKKNGEITNSSVGLLIDADVNSNDPALVDEMERKKERILLQSLQRRQQQEEMKAKKEIETQKRKEQEKQKEELKAQKKEGEKRRRAQILEQHRLKKLIEEAEREGKPLDKEILNAMKSLNMNGEGGRNSNPVPRLRAKKQAAARPRPKTIHIELGSNMKEAGVGSNLVGANLVKRGSTANLAEHNNNNNNIGYGMGRRDYCRGSQDCLLAAADMGNMAGTSASSIYSDLTDDDRTVATFPVKSSNYGSVGRRRGSAYKTSRDVSLDRATSRIARPKFSTYYQSYPRKSSSLMNLCGSSCDQDSFTYNSRYMTDTDSGLGLVTPPHRTSSPGANNSSPSGPGSLPPSHHSRRLRFDDTASESGGSEYSGLRLYKQPTVKSNRGIILNAIEYCVFPGEVNRAKKDGLIEEINRADSANMKHFLILFRDTACKYRALYSYLPETEEVFKVSGVGPRLVTEDMFENFYKYNSGSKNFMQVHTKHLTVTIDAFTIHNSLWQGKKGKMPNKRDLALVI